MPQNEPPREPVEADLHFTEFQATRRPRALARAFDLLAPELLLLAGHLMRDTASAEDLVQETFLRAIEKVDRYDPSRGVQPWMVGILTHLARHEWRRRRRRMPADKIAAETFADPELEVEAREFLSALRQAFAALPPLYRDVLRLYLLHGMTLGEVARTLDRPRNTVKTQQRRGLEELRRHLPKGLSVATVLALVGSRGLAQVRREVLSAAGTSRIALWVTAFAALTFISWVLWPPSENRPPRSPAIAAMNGTATPPAKDPPRVIERASMPDMADETTHLATLKVLVLHRRDERPIPNVEIVLMPNHCLGEFERTTAMTDGLGIALFPNLELGTYMVSSPRGHLQQHVIDRVGSHELRLPVDPGIRLTGEVRDPTGRPLPDATVWAAASNNHSIGASIARTDARGQFAVNDMFLQFAISASKTGFGSPVCRVVGGPVGSDVHVVLTMAAETIVRGEVVDSFGAPVAGALVQVGESVVPPERLGYATRIPRMTWSDATGRFEVRGLGPPGPPLVLWSRARTTGTARIDLEQTEQPRSALRVVLPHAAIMRGTVRSERGQAIANTVVAAYHIPHEPASGALYTGPGFARPTAVTDENGAYVLRGLTPSPTRVRVVTGQGRAHHQLTVEPGGDYQWDATLSSGPILRGTAHAANGQPLTGWEVLLFGPRDATIPGAGRVDPTGSFIIPGCDPVQYRLAIRPAVPFAVRRPVIYGNGRPNSDPVRFVVPGYLVPNAGLRTRLLDHLRQPIPKARVSFIATAHGVPLTLEVETRNGKLNHDVLLPGHQLMHVETPIGSVSREVELAADKPTNLGELIFAEPGTLAGTVRSASGQPLTITAFVEDTRWPVHTALEVRAGRFVSELLQPGNYELTASGPDDGVIHAAFTIRSGETTHLDLTMTAGELVQFQLAPGGDTPRTLRYDVRRADGAIICRRTIHYLRRDRGYEWKIRLPRGRYDVTIEALSDKPWSHRQTIQVRRDGKTVVQLPATGS